MNNKLDTNEIKIWEKFKNISEARSFINAAEETLQYFSDPDFVKKIDEMIPEEGEVIRTPIHILESIARQSERFIRRYPEQGKKVLDVFWKNGSMENKRIAIDALPYLIGVDAENAIKLAIGWLADLDNTMLCDKLALTGMKIWVIENPGEAFALCESLAKSPNPWVRRFGLVCLTNRASRNLSQDLKRFFDVIKNVMEDSDEKVQDAAGNLLMELMKNEPDKVWGFLELYKKFNNPFAVRIMSECTGKSRNPEDEKTGIDDRI